MDRFICIEKLGEGAHGVVLKAKCLDTQKSVALKRIPLKNVEEPIPISILREISTLRTIHHPNIVDLLDFFQSGPAIVLALECMSTDLAQVMEECYDSLPKCLIKCWMQMLLNGVAFCHEQNVMHRDLKPSNLLISEEGILKIADFGLARALDHDSKREYSHQVATRWYRAPELLFGARIYDQGVDIWAIGCIFAEMHLGGPLFAGLNDIDQISRIFQLLGTPNPKNWPEIIHFPDYSKITFPTYEAQSFETSFSDWASPTIIGLLSKLLVYRTVERLSCQEALKHDYFLEYSRPKNTFKQLTFTKPKDLDLKEPLNESCIKIIQMLQNNSVA